MQYFFDNPSSFSLKRILYPGINRLFAGSSSHFVILKSTGQKIQKFLHKNKSSPKLSFNFSEPQNMREKGILKNGFGGIGDSGRFVFFNAAGSPAVRFGRRGAQCAPAGFRCVPGKGNLQSTGCTMGRPEAVPYPCESGRFSSFTIPVFLADRFGRRRGLFRLCIIRGTPDGRPLQNG